MLRFVLPLSRRLAALSPVSRYIVQGPSMLPTFSPGDRIVVNRLAYRMRSPSKGELIALRHPLDEELPLLKRVAAVPGEVVKIGRREYQLGPEEWYVVGDNADSSSDSRVFGPVERHHLIGKIWFRY